MPLPGGRVVLFTYFLFRSSPRPRRGPGSAILGTRQPTISRWTGICQTLERVTTRWVHGALAP